MDLRHFRYFVQIVDSGSLSAASTILHVAQPALSQLVAQLEAELGLPLLIRSVRGVRPTEAGKLLYQRAAFVLRQVSEISAIVAASPKETVGTVCLGLPASLASILGAPLLKLVFECLPHVVLQISELPSSYLAELVATGRLELAVLVSDPLPHGVTGEILIAENIMLISKRGALSPSLEITLKQAAEIPLIVPPVPNDLRRRIDELFANAGLKPIYRSQVAGTALITRAVTFGIGSSLLPWSAVHEDLERGSLEMRDIKGSPFSRVARLAWSTTNPLTPLAERIKAEIFYLVRSRVAGGLWPKAWVPSIDETSSSSKASE